MVSRVENQNKLTDGLLWGLVFILVGTGISGHYYFSSYSLLLRVLALLAVGVVALVLASRTSGGQKAWQYWQEALLEVRKVVWPTKKETTQTTMAVLAMVFVMGLILWSIDAVLIRVVEWLIKT